MRGTILFHFLTNMKMEAFEKSTAGNQEGIKAS